MFYRKTNLLCLPDCILLMILEYIELKELLQVVNRICRRLNDLIVQCSSLWRIFDFKNPALINGEKLKGILKHSQGFERFLIGFWRIDCKIEKLNEIFQQGFYGSPNLYWIWIYQIVSYRLCRFCLLFQICKFSVLLTVQT